MTNVNLNAQPQDPALPEPTQDEVNSIALQLGTLSLTGDAGAAAVLDFLAGRCAFPHSHVLEDLLPVRSLKAIDAAGEEAFLKCLNPGNELNVQAIEGATEDVAFRVMTRLFAQLPASGLDLAIPVEEAARRFARLMRSRGLVLGPRAEQAYSAYGSALLSELQKHAAQIDAGTHNWNQTEAFIEKGDALLRLQVYTNPGVPGWWHPVHDLVQALDDLLRDRHTSSGEEAE